MSKELSRLAEQVKKLKDQRDWAGKELKDCKVELSKSKEVLKLVFNSQLENYLCMYYVLPTEVY